jgi:hypothetical protein
VRDFNDLARFLIARCLAANLFEQAAPANDSTRGLSPGCAKWNDRAEAPGETSRWVIPGSRLLSRFQVRLVR